MRVFVRECVFSGVLCYVVALVCVRNRSCVHVCAHIRLHLNDLYDIHSLLPVLRTRSCALSCCSLTSGVRMGWKYSTTPAGVTLATTWLQCVVGKGETRLEMTILPSTRTPMVPT